MEQPEQATIREATEADLAAIIEIAKATGQEEDWTSVFPAYVRHLIAHGRLLVSTREDDVIGFGGTRQIGAWPREVSMLTDLFVDPAAHGAGTGRAILDVLWAQQPRKMTFSSLHSNALPLYTSFGVDAWWPLLYLGGEVTRLDRPAGWSVESAEPAEVAALELAWTGADRTADHQMWAARPHGIGMIASRNGHPIAAGTGGGVAAEYGISHLVMTRTGEADSADVAGRGADQAWLAADAVVAVLSWLKPTPTRARIAGRMAASASASARTSASGKSPSRPAIRSALRFLRAASAVLPWSVTVTKATRPSAGSEPRATRPRCSSRWMS